MRVDVEQGTGAAALAVVVYWAGLVYAHGFQVDEWTTAVAGAVAALGVLAYRKVMSYVEGNDAGPGAAPDGVSER